MHSNNDVLRRGRLWGAAAAVATTAALILSGCSGGADNTGADGDAPTLTIAMSSPPTSLDPSKASGTTATFQLVAYQGLLHNAGVGLDAEPSLAESYEWVDGDVQTLKVTLREGLAFSDGTVMDSAAVKTSIEHFAKAGSVFSYVAEPIASMDTPDDLTIIFNLSRPVPTFLNDLSEGSGMGSIISPAALETDPEALGTTTAGAGPYALTAQGTVEGSEYRYLPNEHYYDPDAIEFSEVIIKVIADPNTALASLQSGQVDVTYGYPDTYERATSGASIKAEIFNTTVNGLWLQDWESRNVPALADRRVREAINLALDRDAISTAVTLGLGEPTDQVAPVDSLGFDVSLNDSYPYDPVRAEELLAEAGYADGFALPVVIPGFIPTATAIAQAAAAQLSEVGIDLQITSATTFPEYAKGQESGAYAATVFPLGFPAGVPSAMVSLFYPQALINPMRVELPDVLQAAAAASETTGDQAQDAWVQVSQLVIDEAYTAPITTEPAIWYFGDGILTVGTSGPINPAYILPAS